MVKIDIPWNERYVLSLRKALTSYLINKRNRIYRYLWTLIPPVNDAVKIIRRWNVLSPLVQEVIKEYSSSDIKYLLNEGIVDKIDEIKLHPAVPNPFKIIGIGQSYGGYRTMTMLKYPKSKVPLFFFKPINTLTGLINA